MRTYCTLDNVPDFALAGVAQLHHLTTAKFAEWHGAIVYGPCSLSWPSNAYWGRAMTLPSREMLQMRFAPAEAIHDGAEDSCDMVMIATRIQHTSGMAEVHTCVLFRPGTIDFGNLEIGEASARIVGCRGLHFLMAGLFKRHNPTIGADRTAAGSWHYDPKGYQAARSTTRTRQELTTSS